MNRLKKIINDLRLFFKRDLKKSIYLISVFIGLVSGISAVILKNITHLIENLLKQGTLLTYREYFYFAFPLIGIILTQMVIKFVIRRPVGHGIPNILYAISKKKSIIRPYQMIASILTAPITVAFGGSVGLEGPAVSTGASIGSNIGRIFKMKEKTRLLFISAASCAAISAIFNAPIAAIIFTIEVFRLELTFGSMLPLLIASVSAIITSIFIQGDDIILHFYLDDNFKIADTYLFILLGIICAMCSIYFTKMYFAINRLFSNFKGRVFKILIGSFLIGIILFFLPPLYGEGLSFVSQLLSQDLSSISSMGVDIDDKWIMVFILLILIFFKVIASSVTFEAGGIGGIFAPTLFIGSCMGLAFSKFINNLGLNVSEVNFTMVGMAGLMAGVLHAPLTSIFLIAEITRGYELFIPLMITSTISFIITKFFISHSVYTMQLAKRGQLFTHNKDKTAISMIDIQEILEKDFYVVRSNISSEKLINSILTKSNRNIFPVLDKDDKLIGILNLNDFRHIVFDKKLSRTFKIQEYIKIPKFAILSNDDVNTIVQKFQNSNEWNLPVVNFENNKYIGFISKSKLFSIYRNKIVEISQE